MQRKLIKYLNASILGLSILFALGAAFLWLCRPNEIPELEPQPIRNTLPKGAFSLTPADYKAVGEPILTLNYQPPALKLPDLKSIITYYGKNGRPDAQAGKELLHFAVNGGASRPTLPNEKVYLVYNPKSETSKYSFSPNNEKTSLWFEATPLNNEAVVTVHLYDDKGQKVTGPENFESFNLAEKEVARSQNTGWELGKWRVDATLLARQKARWVGHDRFLEEHGGQEFDQAVGSQRIDFGEGDEAYSLFVKPGDSLVYEKDQWKVVKPGDDSLKEPLMVVKRVDERLMNFELWDVQGKSKVILNLLKVSENFAQQNFEQIFKFLGARTRSQYVFEIDNERVLLSRHDWLLLTDTGWKKLETPKEIDDYVERKVVGTLFVFDSIIKKDDRQYMKGTVYNQSRTESYPVELAMQSVGPAEKQGNKPQPDSGMGKVKAAEAVGRKKPKIDPPSYAKQE